MRFVDEVRFAFGAVRAQATRSLLTAVGIAVGIAAVVLLTTLGDGVQRYVLSEFTQFGTNLVGISPGRTTTMGMSGAVINTVRPLTLDDAVEIERLPGVVAITGVVSGNGSIEAGRRSRRAAIHGVSADAPAIWSLELALGHFLPHDDPVAPRPFAVLGAKLRDELFRDENPLGQWLRTGGERYRVVGVLEPKGTFLGFDLDDAVYIPTARGLGLFDREGLMELDVQYRPGEDPDAFVASLRRLLIARHGDEDFTIVEQQQMLDVLGSVAVGPDARGRCSRQHLAARRRRRHRDDHGHRAARATLRDRAADRARRDARRRAAAVPVRVRGPRGLGGLLGLAVGMGGAWLLGHLIPGLPVELSLVHAAIAEGVAILLGLAAGTLPALRAAGLRPVDALRAE
jgi:putative ABC transport system permease protein